MFQVPKSIHIWILRELEAVQAWANKTTFRSLKHCASAKPKFSSSYWGMQYFRSPSLSTYRFCVGWKQSKHVRKKQFFGAAFFLQALNSKQLFFSHLSCETQTSPALQKHLFRLSKTVIFPRCSYETQRSPALQKNIFQALCFFALLLWNSNKPGFAKKQLFRP